MSFNWSQAVGDSLTEKNSLSLLTDAVVQSMGDVTALGGAVANVTEETTNDVFLANSNAGSAELEAVVSAMSGLTGDDLTKMSMVYQQQQAGISYVNNTDSSTGQQLGGVMTNVEDATSQLNMFATTAVQTIGQLSDLMTGWSS